MSETKEKIRPIIKIAAILAMIVAVGAALIPNGELVAGVAFGVAVLFMIVIFAFHMQDQKRAQALRGIQHGFNAILTIFVVIGMLVSVNYLANRYNVSKDLTKNKVNSLSDQTIKLMKDLKNEITIVSFVNPEYDAVVKELIKRMQIYTDKLKVEYADPVKEPLKAKEYGVSQSRPDVIVIQSAERKHTIETPNPTSLEEQIANGVIAIQRDGKKRVYFLSGHGEKSLSVKEQAGLSGVKESLEKGFYEAHELSLFEKAEIPADAEIIVIAGPTKPPLDSELKALRDYLNRAERPGHLLLMADPETPQEWNELTKSYGLTFSNRSVVEFNPQAQMLGGSPLAPTVKEYNTTTDLGKNFSIPSLMFITSDVSMNQKLEAGVETKWVAKTGANSFATTIRPGEQRVQFIEGRDIKGPVVIAAMAQRKQSTSKPADAPAGGDVEKINEIESRVLLYGDSDFATNNFSRFAGNLDLFLNSISWLSKDSELISIRPRPADESKLEITQFQGQLISRLTLILLPLLFFGVSYAIYRYRLVL